MYVCSTCRAWQRASTKQEDGEPQWHAVHRTIENRPYHASASISSQMQWKDIKYSTGVKSKFIQFLCLEHWLLRIIATLPLHHSEALPLALKTVKPRQRQKNRAKWVCNPSPTGPRWLFTRSWSCCWFLRALRLMLRDLKPKTEREKEKGVSLDRD